ncbi:polysaccharide lyase family 1 protein [Asticcacaulis sp. YBE204]|uniref:pectate lyase family protein n=1 Tax=Asticcacaulis sp. YBE204 TaxID=1282363 RepID=UPI0003C3E0A7|nr:hypothetical protein [Asticcacaulis sp. YBE204]ESQ81130.1 hypothetical protein AEYBE204_02010 [Asticcacaulis sp. YBE204]
MIKAFLCGAFAVMALALPVQAKSDGLNRATYDTQGWASTQGGAGGQILRVTNLNATGPGSFRAAVETDGPRIIVFEVGGVIDLGKTHIAIKKPFLTIAGQTAPNPGITFIRGAFSVSTHDVIIQHIAVRPGEAGAAKKSGWEADGLSTYAAYNVIIDHCSFSWATDENLSTSGPRFNGATPDDWRQSTSRNITLSHNLIYEGLKNSTHTKGEHSKGTLVHDNASGILIYGNLYASNYERNAFIKGGAQAAMVNNLIFNPGIHATHYNLVAREWEGQTVQTGLLTLIGNAYRAGPDTVKGTALFKLGGIGDVSLYLRNNLALDTQGQPLPMTGRYTTSDAKIVEAATPYLPEGLRIRPAAEIEQAVPLSAGMRPWARDPIDARLLSELAQKRGMIIDSESQSGGYPAYAPTRRAFVPDDWNLADMSPKAGWDSLFKK